ncbi:MAG: hypothetical protein FXV79_00455 [Candidatus Thioglobus sp.]|nr:MAG: hypothetical protein FXV80_02025 [Candidatus Thioglobus sp.]KAA0456432.1 MAG: hypothetical protein FXV79_00455 [Candidatus Thioglobus sp.]
MKKILSITTIALALSFLAIQTSCTQDDKGNGQTSSKSAKSGKYASMLKSVKAEQKKARKAGFEWNTIRKLIKSAAKKHKAGKDNAAIKLLKKAKGHAILGQKQARIEANARPRF